MTFSFTQGVLDPGRVRMDPMVDFDGAAYVLSWTSGEPASGDYQQMQARLFEDGAADGPTTTPFPVSSFWKMPIPPAMRWPLT